MTTPAAARKFTADADLIEAEGLIKAAFPDRINGINVTQTMSGKYAYEFTILNHDGSRDSVEFVYADTLDRATHRTIRRIDAILEGGA